MFRSFVIAAAAIAALVMPAAAQAPEGWQVRIDKSTNAQDPDDTPDLKVMAMGKGFHVTGGPAGTFWDPKNVAKGNYTATATFNLMKPSGHVNYYGLIIGGQDLGGPKQSYIYFLVAQNGTFTIRHRAGEEVHDILARQKSEAVRVPGADGRSSNTLEVRVGASDVQFVVNGTVVHKAPKSGMTAQTDGIAGVRVNHQLDVHIDGFAVKQG